MSSKPYIEKEKPDFYVVVNGRKIGCFKDKACEISETISNFVKSSPEANSMTIKIPIACTENDFDLISKVLHGQRIFVSAANSPVLIAVSKSFNIPALESRVNYSADERARVYRALDIDEDAQNIKKIMNIFNNLNDENNTLISLLEKYETAVSAQLLFDAAACKPQQIELLAQFIQRILQKNDNLKNKLSESLINEFIIRSNIKMLQSDGFFFRHLYNCQMFDSEMISKLPAKLKHVSPIINDFGINIDYNYLNENFHPYCVNLHKMKNNNWELHKRLADIGQNPDPILTFIRKDNAAEIEDISKSLKGFSFLRLIPPSAFERCDYLNTGKVSLCEYAAYFGAVNCLKFIYESIVDNLDTPSRNIADFAVAGGHISCIEFCESKKISLGGGCAFEAVVFHQNDLFSSLIEKKRQKIEYGNLMEASIRYSNVFALELCIAKGSCVDPCMMLSTKYRIPVLSRFFIRQKLQQQTLNLPDESDGKTGLYYACEYKYLDVIQDLFENGADVNIQDSCNDRKYSPLHICCINGLLEGANIILKASNVNVNILNCNKKTPLHMACENCHKELVNILVSRNDTDVNIISNGGESPLLLAISSGSLEIIDILIGLGERLKINTCCKESLAISACKSKNIAVVQKIYDLLGKEKCGFDKKEALIEACSHGDTSEIIKFIIEEIGTTNGLTEAFEASLKHGNNKAALYLISLDMFSNPSFVKLNHLVYEKKVLEKAVKHCNCQVVKALYQKMQELNQLPDDEGRGALIVSCNRGAFDIADFLVNEAKVPLNIAGPLHTACKNGFIDIVKLLLNYDETVKRYEEMEADNEQSKPPTPRKNKSESQTISKGTKTLDNTSTSLNIFSPDMEDNAKIDVNALGLIKDEEDGYERHLAPIHIALRYFNDELFYLLLRYPGLDAGKLAYSDFCVRMAPIHFAIRARNLPAVQKLIERPDVDRKCRLIRGGDEKISCVDLAWELGFKEIENAVLLNSTTDAKDKCDVSSPDLYTEHKKFFCFEKPRFA